MISVEKLNSFQDAKVAEWHLDFKQTETEMPWVFVEENLKWNYLLWHEEDIARIQDIDPLRIVEAKRNIDKFNQARNNAMEKIDEWILNYFQSNNINHGERIHSETPGMMIDRLAIMSLKKYHMAEETMRTDADDEHKEKCRAKVSILTEQIKDLSSALEHVLSELLASRLRFKVYRQLKMYNDPSLNPELYKRSKPGKN